MAKYAPSALIGRISRSAGSTTFGHNRFGAYFRNRVIPTNPMTSAQTEIRTNLGASSSAWRDLSDVQRAAWSAFGENFAKTDSLGETYSLTGQQAFVSVRRNLFTYSGAPSSVLVPPLYAPPAVPVIGAITLEEGAFSIAFSPTPLTDNAKLVIEATRALSAGISFQQRGAYKQIFVGAVNTASPANVDAGWSAIYGLRVVGEKILIRAYVVSETGLASPVATAAAIVAETP